MNFEHQRIRSMEIAQLAADRLRFERDLRALYPDLRFALMLESRHWKFPEVVFLKTSLDRRAKYRRIYAWVTAADWRPVWRPPDKTSPFLICENRPGLELVLRPVEITANFCPRQSADDRIQTLWARYDTVARTTVEGVWREGHPEQKQFLDTAIRLLKRRATNNLITIDKATGKPRHAPMKGQLIWADEAVLEWLRGAPNRFVDYAMRPAEDYGTYRWPLPVADEYEPGPDGRGSWDLTDPSL